MMNRYLLGASLFYSLSAFSCNCAVETALIGSYECAGHEVGSKEKFTCQMIIKQTGETYASSASCSDGNSYRGTGIYDKSTHRLSTGFVNPKNAAETGVSVSRLKGNGHLITQWTYLDKTSIALTKCHKQEKK